MVFCIKSISFWFWRLWNFSPNCRDYGLEASPIQSIQRIWNSQNQFLYFKAKDENVWVNISTTSWTKFMIRIFTCRGLSIWYRKYYSLLNLVLYFSSAPCLYCIKIVGLQWPHMSLKLKGNVFIIKNHYFWFCSYLNNNNNISCHCPLLIYSSYWTVHTKIIWQSR